MSNTRRRPRRAPLRVLSVTLLFLLVATSLWPGPGAQADTSPGAADRAGTTTLRAPTRFVLPIEFAAVARPFAAPAHRYAAGHRGVDLVTGAGATVLAPADGVLAFVGRVAGRPVVAIDHGGGRRSAIEPVTSHAVAGDPVRRGEPIGSVGEGGHCHEVCVHWGVRHDGEYVDPMSLVERRVILLPLGTPWTSGRRPH